VFEGEKIGEVVDVLDGVLFHGKPIGIAEGVAKAEGDRLPGHEVGTGLAEHGVIESGGEGSLSIHVGEAEPPEGARVVIFFPGIGGDARFSDDGYGGSALDGRNGGESGGGAFPGDDGAIGQALAVGEGEMEVGLDFGALEITGQDGPF